MRRLRIESLEDRRLLSIDLGPPIIYVDADAPGDNDGTSWQSAFVSLQDGLAAATDKATIEEIRVAEGVYTPDQGEGQTPGNREATFQLVDDVVILGGFAGFGASQADARDIDLYETTLSGDLSGNDGPDFAGNAENSYHVVTTSGTIATAVLDGVTITGGSADQDYPSVHRRGGGVYNDGGSPTLIDCSIRGHDGGGVFSGRMTGSDSEADPTLIRCTISENDDEGIRSGDQITMIDCVIRDNFGRGMDSGGRPTLTNCVFSGNTGGGWYSCDAYATLVNCLFVGNTSDWDSGAWFSVDSDPVLTNCVFVGNRAANQGGGIYSSSDYSFTMTNCILWGNRDAGGMDESAQIQCGSAAIDYSCVQGWTGALGGTGNFGDDPLFASLGRWDDADTPDDPSDDVWIGGNYRLQPDSPCIDAGDNTAVPWSVTVDLAGDPRFADDPDTPNTGNGTPPIVDMGTYEGHGQGFVVDPRSLTVAEGGTATFTVALATDPGDTVEVRVARQSGDEDISVDGAAVLTFDSSNYGQPQTVILSAAEDLDNLPGETVIEVRGSGLPSALVTGREVDDEPVAAVLHVDAGATGANTGASWADAYAELRDALAIAGAHAYVEAICVAEGDYAPAGPNGPREATLPLRSDLAVYGGFPAGGGLSWEDRDGLAFPAVLTGDLNGDDAPFATAADLVNDPTRNDNSYHVVTIVGAGATALLDGLTITGGYADGEYYLDDSSGGGIYIDDCQPTLVNCTVRGNSAGYAGGAIYVQDGEPTLIGCRILDNEGQGLYAIESQPTLTGCTFQGNYGTALIGHRSNFTVSHCDFTDNFSSGGGAIAKYWGSATLTGCTFVGNQSTYLGGAMSNHYGDTTLVDCVFRGNESLESAGGAMYNASHDVTMINCLVTGNSGQRRGGALRNFKANVSLVNCTLVGNSTAETQGGISSTQGTTALTNCILWANRDSNGNDESAQLNSGTVDYSCVQGWTGALGGTGNFGDDPAFIDADGGDDVFGTDDDNARLLPGSPCIDAGDNAAVPPWVTSDIEGRPRFDNEIVDLGAYESPEQGLLIRPLQVHVGEGQTASFTVALLLNPHGPVEVTVTRVSGDEDITVASGALLRFDSSDYQVPQTVTLAAAEDDDYLNGSAIISVAAPGFIVGGVAACEVENDPVPRLIYVDDDALGKNNGTSWEDAYLDLQDALREAEIITAAFAEAQIDVHVAGGRYTPAAAGSGDREATFELISRVSLYGGFPSSGGTWEDRNPAAHQTVLSGDVNGNDAPVDNLDHLSTESTRSENSYHVVTGSGTDATAVLSGFLITGGQAYWGPDSGAGMLNEHGSPTVDNCTFVANASQWGGAMRNELSQPTVIDCVFRENFGGNGGAVYNVQSDATFTGCTFVGNQGFLGGAVKNNLCSPTLIDCGFFDNTAGSFGAVQNISSDPTLINCIFSGNSVTESGGAVGNSNSDPLLVNCSFTNNSAHQYGGAIFALYKSHPRLVNCVLWGNSARYGPEIALRDMLPDPYPSTVEISYSVVEAGREGAYVHPNCGLSWGAGNLALDPQFIAPAGPDEVIGTPDDNLRLLPGSPCIDAADNTALPIDVVTDLDGNPRIVNETVDIGAYEFQGPFVSEVLYVDDDALGANDGTSWEDAFVHLQDALATAAEHDLVREIRVADGRYQPDQGNSQTPGDREATFQLLSGVVVLGGYAGFDTADPDAHDPVAFVSILSGDLAGDDAPIADPFDLWHEPSRDENSVHVVTGNGTDATAVLDGFTITAGKADAFQCGGGAVNFEGTPTYRNCAFVQNWSNKGGGMYNAQDGDDGLGPLLVNCSFLGNWGNDCGGGMYNSSSSPTLINCTFSGNIAEDYGGGGMFNSGSDPTLINCTMTGNRANDGGSGIYNSSSNPLLANCIVWGNLRDQITTNSGSEPVITYSVVQGGWEGEGNLDVDPQLVDADGPDGVFGTADDNLRLSAASPCIDAGSNAAVPDDVLTDLDGNPRIVGPAVDMGAYESSELPQFEDLVFSTIPSAQAVGVPFDVTLTAWDADGHTATDFTGTVDLGGRMIREVIVGGSEAWEQPLRTSYDDSRTQAIYLRSELGAAGTITALALDVLALPGQTMESWTIRMKHTPLSEFSEVAWDGAGWTAVYQNDESITSHGWVNFEFSTPFEYNGVDNLMIDFSFNNFSSSYSGEVAAANDWEALRCVYFNTESEYGDPLTWSATSGPTPYWEDATPNIRLLRENGVVITPTVSGNFVDGAWTGQLAVLEEADAVSLRAEDRWGRAWYGNTFDVRFAEDLCEIHGRKFHDLDGDGDWGSQEPALADWTVYLDENENGQFDGGERTAATDAEGGYSFTSLVSGLYTVAEVIPDGWQQTFPATEPDPLQRASNGLEGTLANQDSDWPAISADGRYVAFQSLASNLVPGDTNDRADIFVYDRQTETIERVSVAFDGSQANGPSGEEEPAISADGRYVAFSSWASNLVPGDTNELPDVFVYDRQTDTIERVSVGFDGSQAVSRCQYPALNADGRFVAFSSESPNLVPGDTNDCWDVFVYDRQTETIERVSVASDGSQSNSSSYRSSLSAYGRYVAFATHASNLVPDDTNELSDVFVCDRLTGVLDRVSVASDGTQGNAQSYDHAISADGRYVAFESDASNLVPGDTNAKRDIFVFDRETGTIECASVAADGTPSNSYSQNASINGDGRYVAFASGAGNLVPGDTNYCYDTFVYDRHAQVTRRVSRTADGSSADGHSMRAAISSDGRYLAFRSQATNLVPEDTSIRDVFVAPTMTAGLPDTHTVVLADGQTVEQLDFGNRALTGEIRGSKFHDLDGDGHWDDGEPGLEGWTIYADTDQDGRLDDDESSAVTNAQGDYTLTHLPAGTYTVAEVNQDRWRQTFPSYGDIERVNVAADGSQANDRSFHSAFSADGRFVAFRSGATNLVPEDTNGKEDVFLVDRQTGTVQCVSRAWDGSQANGNSDWTTLSADGRFVAFESDATNLVPGGSSLAKDVYVFDRQTNSIECASMGLNGSQGGGFWPALSANGRLVTFTSRAGNLVPGDTNGEPDVFVYDRQTGTTERVSLASDGSQADRFSYHPEISADGRFVTFYSGATTLVPGDANGENDVFVYDRQTDTIQRVSLASDGSQADGDSFSPSISADGRYVAFLSRASNLVPEDTNGGFDIFLHDRQTATTRRVSVAADGSQANGDSHVGVVSGDGRYVAFYSHATNLAPGDTNGEADVFMHDCQTGVTRRVSMAFDGSEANEISHQPAISADGRFIAFQSHATNLVPDDANGALDIFVVPTSAAGRPGRYAVSLDAGQVLEDLDFGNQQTDASLIVSTLADENDGNYAPGDLSLREAIALAAARPGEDTIRFDTDLSGGTITLQPSLGQLSIDSNVEILGLGADRLTVNANGNSRVFYVPSGITATISGLTITGGRLMGDHGAGVYNDGTLTIADAVIHDNETDTDSRGGGIYNDQGTLTVLHTTIAGNYAGAGGGLKNFHGQATLTDVTIRENMAREGGGVGIHYGATTTIRDATISKNSPEGIRNFGDLTLEAVTISENSGGGILNEGPLSVADSTICNNAAVQGGGIRNYRHPATLINTTISGNSSQEDGGGVYVNGGSVTLLNTTIAGNRAGINSGGISGGGIFRYHGHDAVVTLHNSIVAGNLGVHGTADDVAGTFDAASSHNLIGAIDGSTNLDSGPGTLYGTTASPLNPRLGPLQDSGGPTLTHALLSSSPALDAGSNDRANNAGLTHDQRGFDRFVGSDVVGTATVDMGAYEFWGIEGFAWEDLNSDGIQDAVEIGVRDATVNLLDASLSVVATTTTDINGNYGFSPLLAGEYTLEFVVPAWVTFSPQDQGGNDVTDSDVDPLTGWTAPLMLTSGQSTDRDAGLSGPVAAARVGDLVWNDLDGNGIQDADEPGVGDVVVSLLDNNLAQIATTTTAPDGTYSFDELAPGWYSLQFGAPDGFTFSPMNRGNDDLLDSDVNRSTGRTASFYLMAGQDDTSRDAGLYAGPFDTDVQSWLRITEIMPEVSDYNPHYDEYVYAEFIELKNIGPEPLDLTGVRFIDGIDFDFRLGSLASLFPGEYLVLVDSLQDFSRLYETAEINVAGQYQGRLDNQPERIELVAPINRIILEFSYDPEWFAITTQQSTEDDPGDFSLTILDETADPTSWDGPSNWRPSSLEGGSPGTDDPRLTPDPGTVVINEIMTNPSDRYNDWIELHNTTDEDIDIGGWYLADDKNGRPRFTSYRIAPGTMIPAGGYVVFTRADHFGFGLSSYGERLQLTAGDAEGNLLGYSESVIFGGAETEVTFGPYGPDFVALSEPTMGSENAAPKVGPVVINEIMYQPGYLGDEFLELHNVTAEPVNMGGWGFDGIWYDLPADTLIPGHGFLLLVPIDPEEFRARYAIADEVLIVGPYDGALDNAGEDLRLYKRADFNRRVLVDRVHYDDELPWPEEADLGGGSLERVLPTAYGNTPANWAVTTMRGGTPGQRNSIADTPVDLAITKTDGQEFAQPGQSVTYTITVTNHSALGVMGGTVTDVFPSELTEVTWTAVASLGSRCTTSGTADIQDTVDLPAGGTVTYTATGTIDPAATGMLTNEATAATPAGLVEATPEDNTASDTDILISPGLGGMVSTAIDEIDGDYSPGDLSLREALALAAGLSGDDVIQFDSSLMGVTITLDPALGQLVIDSNVSIQGLGADRLTIDADGNSRVFYVSGAVEATISGLTVTGGNPDGAEGGGIYNRGDLTITNSTISGNSASADAPAGSADAYGGIYNRGDLTITNSTISDNSASADAPAGSAHAYGGIYSRGDLTITNSTVSGNSASADAPAGSAHAYGGIYSRADLTITNSTISGNSVSATAPSGSPHANGGGVYVDDGTVILHNTIVAGNFRIDQTTADDVYGTFDTASSHNLIGVIDGSTGLDGNGTLYGTAAAPLDPMLGPLRNNGGSTPTHALLPGSPAIDAAANDRALDAGLTIDQRGLPRFFDGDGNGTITVDMGAYEYGLTVPVEVVDRHVFYSGSFWDTPTAKNSDFDDDTAIAPDKKALLPGETATFANYTNCSNGINGIMVDIVDLPLVEGSIDPTDYFTFKVGNDDNPGAWGPCTVLPTATVRPGEGVNYSDRVTLIWSEGAVRNQWLQVTVLANENTGLAQNDVFYFGNLVAEIGDKPDTEALVGFADFNGYANDYGQDAPIDALCDFDRDGTIAFSDFNDLANNYGHSIELITVPTGKDAKSPFLDPRASRPVPTRGTAKDMRGIDRVPAHDAVLEQAARREAKRPPRSSGKMDWLCEFETAHATRRPAREAKLVDRAVDLLLATRQS